MYKIIKYLASIIPVLSLLIVLSINIMAQTSGTLDGTVVDETGKLVANALVTVTNENDGTPHTARSTADGRYVIPFLEPGRYTIKISLDNYQDSELINFVIPLNKVTVTLPPIVIRSLASIQAANSSNTPSPTPAPSTTSSSTSSNKTLIDLTDATNRGNYDSSLLTSLPLGGIRSFDFFALLAPGVLPAPATGGAAGPGIGPGVGTSGQFAVNGRRARSNNFTIDGSDNNDQDIGVRRQGFVALVPQSIESVNEFQISTQTWDAELGRNIGAQVNAVSRSGGNDIHGTAYGFFNNDRLNARNFFDLTGGASQGKDKITRSQVGFVVGGPIVRDRTHYFISFERQDLNANQEHHFSVPDVSNRQFNGVPFSTSIGQSILAILPRANNVAGPYGISDYTQVLPTGADGTVFSIKLTHKIGNSIFTGRYNFTNDSSIIPSVGGAINASIGTKTRTQNLSLFYDSSLSQTSFNQVRFSYGRTTLSFPPQAGSPLLFGESQSTLNLPQLTKELNSSGGFQSDPYLRAVTSSFGSFGPFGRTGPIGQLVVNPFSPVGIDPFTFPQARSSNTFQLADTFVKTLGNHSIKLGGDFKRNQLNSVLDRNFRPQVVFSGGIFFNPRRGPSLLLGTDSAVAGVVSEILQTVAITPDSTIGLRFNEYNLFAQDTWRVKSRLSVNYGIRYENSSVPVETNNRIENTFNFMFPTSDPRIAQSTPGATRQNFFEGFLSAAQGSLNRFLDGRDKIYRPDNNNFSPRIGIAYDPFGNSTTVIRAGYGLYYDQIIGSVTSQSRNVFPSFIPIVLDPRFTFDEKGRILILAGARAEDGLRDVGLNFSFIKPGTLNTLGFGGGLLRYGIGELLLTTGASNPGFNGGPRGGGLAFILPDANLRTPYSQHWNLSVEHQFARDFVFTASYVGSTGTKLIRFRTPNGGPNSFNVIVPDTSLPNLFRPVPVVPKRQDPNLGPFTVIESSAASIYHSLQLSLNKRMSNGLQLGASYTYSHSIDEVSDVFDTAGGFTLPQDDSNLAAERGSSSFDVRHRSVSYFTYDVPFFSKSPFFGGFQLAGVATLQTGQPFTVNISFDTNRDGNLTDRPASSALIKQVDNGIQRLSIPSAKSLQLRDLINLLRAGDGISGGLGRNTFRSPGVASFDLAIIKRVKITDRQGLLIRTEFFNLFNRTHFATPVRIIGAPNFGNSVSTSLPARIIQFAVKYQF